MLSGLNGGETKLSEVELSHFFLLGANFYAPAKRRALAQLDPGALVERCFSLLRGTVSEIDSEVILYDLGDAKSNFLEKKTVTNHINSAKKIALPGDFVISRLRSYLRETAVVPHRAFPQAFSSEFLILRANPDSPVTAETMLAFCLSNHAQTILHHSQYGTEHPRFYEFTLKEMPIPLAVIELNAAISKLVALSQKKREQANAIYERAQQLLARELGIADFHPDESSITIRSFDESLAKTDRLDAEYYRPKYDSMLAVISQFPCKRLADIVSVVKSVEPGSDAYCDSGIPFVRVADLTKFGVTTTDKYLSPQEWAKWLPRLRPQKDDILLTKDGTVGIAYKTESDLDVVVSGAILRLIKGNNAAILPDYLALVLNSPCVQLQAERDTGGSIIAHWRLDDVKSVVIPILSTAKQRALADKARESFRLRRESEKLLATAKHAVETAIEKGEAEALRFIEKSCAD